MFKAMILLKRKESMSRQDFARWWLEAHAPLARQLPGLKKAVFNLVQNEEDSDVDGISELWFDSRADFDSAYASDIGQQVAADSIANVANRMRLLVQEHPVA